MILGKTGITVSQVATAVGSSSKDVGTLCTHPSINMWSKWKPINSPISTMTLDELHSKHYGVKILEAGSPSELVSKIKSNGNVGATYDRPKGGSSSPFRLGDFRNYDSGSYITIENSSSQEKYKGGVMKVGGLDSTNHDKYEVPLDGFEVMQSDTTITTDELYDYYNYDGTRLKLRRGAYVTDGYKGIWYTDKIYWWDWEAQQFWGKTVDVYEFLTNAKKTPSEESTHTAIERYFSLPEPHFQLKISRDQPAGSKIVTPIVTVKFRPPMNPWETPGYGIVDYTVYFDATTEAETGGEIYNVYVSLSSDYQGKNTIGQRLLADTITVPKGQRSIPYTGYFMNRPTSGSGAPQKDVYFIVEFNHHIQFSQQPSDSELHINEASETNPENTTDTTENNNNN